MLLEFLKISYQLLKTFFYTNGRSNCRFLSCNLLGSGKYGVYFTSSGLYWKNWLLGKGNLKWEQLNKVQQIEIDKDGFLSFDAQKVSILTGVTIPTII